MQKKEKNEDFFPKVWLLVPREWLKESTFNLECGLSWVKGTSTVNLVPFGSGITELRMHKIHEFFANVNLLKNSLAVKKVLPLSKWPVWKNCEIKGAAKKWLWWYRLMAKILIATIQVNLHCLIPALLGISTKFTWIVVTKNFAINLYHYSHFLATLWFYNFFHTGHFEQYHTFFYSLAVFEWISLLFAGFSWF